MAAGEAAASSSRLGARTHTTATSESAQLSVHVRCAQVVRPEKQPKPEPKYVVQMPGVGRGNNPASHANLQPRAKKEQSENEEPQYGVLPSSINAGGRSCPAMSAFLLQEPGPWIALQAMDGSGELCA